MSSQSGTVFVSGEKPEKDKHKNIPKEEKQLSELANYSEDTLYELSGLFPFDLFPDKVIITPNKVTVVHKTLFFKNIFPMLIANINSVVVSRGLFFSAMKFEVTGYEENPDQIRYLHPKEADKAKRIILGLVDAVKKNIDVAKVKPRKARPKLEKIGRVHEKLETWA